MLASEKPPAYQLGWARAPMRLASAVRVGEPGIGLLGLCIAGTRRLAQQLMTDTAVTRVAAVAAQQLPQAALRRHDALARGLLQQAAGEVLDRGFVTQAGAVEQPQCHFQ